jgi:hypothetical protein
MGVTMTGLAMSFDTHAFYVRSLYMTKKTEHVEIVHNINFTKRLKDESNQRAFSDIK